LFCSLNNTDGSLFGDPQNVLHNENHEKFLLSEEEIIANGKISGGICKGFSSLIKFVNPSLLSLLFLVCWFSYFVEFAPAKLALLAHPNRGNS